MVNHLRYRSQWYLVHALVRVLMSIGDEDTVELFSTKKPSDPIEAVSFEESEIEIAAITHRGLVRRTNEDHYAMLRRTRKGELLATSLRQHQLDQSDDYSWLLAVADGLGGQVSGEVASATAIRTVLDVANRLSNWIMRPTEGLRNDFEERVEIYARTIQAELQQQAKSNPHLAGMATTLTGTYIYGSHAVVVGIGDSRSYLIRSHAIHQITRDHTMAEDLKKKGLGERETRPYRNLLTRCFSTADEPISVDMFHLDLQPHDRLLLCSDGLTDMVSDHNILRIVMATDSTADICQRLVLAALDEGGRDNITVAMARIADPHEYE